ncbi:hypothetical protein FRC06_001057 [Ceratobasidium sp. 370]|nr:hypothetical protein FRC06_001057 [Ceratobasidium sp. 370]
MPALVQPVSSSRPRVQRIDASVRAMPNYHQSPSSSVSSLSGSDIVFSQPALAANRDNDLVIDLDTDDESSNNVFAWPTIESPAAHHTSPLRPSHRALLLTGSSEIPPRNLQPSSVTPAASSVATAASDRRRHALAIALSREAEQAADPSTSLARRIAARESARTSSSPPQQDQYFPTTRLLSRTTISVAEPDPPADLRRLATTREAERQLHYRDWHRLGLLDPSTSVAGSDGAGVSPGRLTPQLAYARRRPSAATTRGFPLSSDNNDDQDDDIDVLSMDITQRLRRRMAALDALDSVSESQLEREREHDPSAPLPSVSSSIRTIDRRMARFRSWGLSSSRLPEWGDGRDDPNGELVYNDSAPLTTPAGRSRYWNTLSNAATDDLLALAAERTNRHTPLHPPGLAAPAPQQVPVAAKPKPADPLPSPLGTMLLPTPKQRFVAAFRTS